MAKILISPSKYIQGPGELNRLGQYVEKLGKKALVENVQSLRSIELSTSM